MTKRTLVDEAADPDTPFGRLLQLSKSNNIKVRRALVDNPSIAVNEEDEVTNKILLRLAKEFPDEVAACSAFALFGLELKEGVLMEVVNTLAGRAKDPGILAILFHEFGLGDVDVRWRIAQNPNTPPDLLRFMADKNNEPEAYVRAGVAKNPKTPLDVLRFMADKNNESNSYVREGVARNHNTPQDVLRFMVNKKNEPAPSVRLGVVDNLNTTEDILHFLADENNEPAEYVRRSAIQALKDRGLL